MAEGTASVIGKIKEVIAKLPFNNLVGKIPALAKFSGYANYAACVLAVLVLGKLLVPSNSVKPAVNELKKINDEHARFWINMIEANGIDAIYDEESLIGVAVKSNNYDLVEACIKSGANINLHQNAASSYGSTPVVIAVQNDYANIVELLIKNKAVLVEHDHQYYDALHATLSYLDEDIMKLVLPKVPKSEINFLDKNNKREELSYQAHSGGKDLVNMINNYGYKTKENFHVLALSIIYFDDEELPQLIKAIKTTASESYHKKQPYASEFITQVENAWETRMGHSENDPAENEKQKNDLISWLEKQGYGRKAK